MLVVKFYHRLYLTDRPGPLVVCNTRNILVYKLSKGSQEMQSSPLTTARLRQMRHTRHVTQTLHSDVTQNDVYHH